MSDQIDRLRTIMKLRKRDLERCQREVAAARQEVAAAQVQEEQAARACAMALSKRAAALMEQVRQPCDPLVQLHCQAVSARADASQQVRAQAGAVLAEARVMADRLKREWLRAQARHDAIFKELERAIQQWQRQVSRRAEEELRPAPSITALA
ncbi:hypothetical protein C100_10500 [Sphingobium sp. C100]|jgi:hypothetical protein|uniref:hypothetical protein n=1 Tax=Sphingobium sp. C100 TaxID=1207055 RepID=UPI0003D682A7|nr:hypothetical protein [Sphingobium sp. C100]ETI63849.1 hypothetical protein C100_10500 [Sphingobium sp. C100]PHQ62890.1 MAG: hypothetical protein COC10_09055 [Sphingobium sp.]